MIKLTGRSPRLVRRWHDLGLLTGFSMLRRWPSSETTKGRHRADGLREGISHPRHEYELWANDLGLVNLPDPVGGKPFALPDLGTETIVSKLAEDHSARALARVLFNAGFSLLTIGRVLKSRHTLRLNGQPDSDRLGLDWLRWEIFKSRWLEHKPSAALLSLPGPDAVLHRRVHDHAVQSPACPERQVEYAQALLASYLLVDSITRQAVRVAQQQDIALIVLIDPSTGSATPS